MIPWDELSKRDKLAIIYSDLHKDFYGMRPDYEKVDQWGEDELSEEIRHITSLVEKNGWPE